MRIGVDGNGDFLGAGVFLAAEGRLRGVNRLARRNAGRRRRLAGDRRVHNLSVIAARRAGERGRRGRAVLGPRPGRRLAVSMLADNRLAGQRIAFFIHKIRFGLRAADALVLKRRAGNLKVFAERNGRFGILFHTDDQILPLNGDFCIQMNAAVTESRVVRMVRVADGRKVLRAGNRRDLGIGAGDGHRTLCAEDRIAVRRFGLDGAAADGHAAVTEQRRVVGLDVHLAALNRNRIGVKADAARMLDVGLVALDEQVAVHIQSVVFGFLRRARRGGQNGVLNRDAAIEAVNRLRIPGRDVDVHRRVAHRDSRGDIILLHLVINFVREYTDLIARDVHRHAVKRDVPGRKQGGIPALGRQCQRTRAGNLQVAAANINGVRRIDRDVERGALLQHDVQRRQVLICADTDDPGLRRNRVRALDNEGEFLRRFKRNKIRQRDVLDRQRLVFHIQRDFAVADRRFAGVQPGAVQIHEVSPRRERCRRQQAEHHDDCQQHGSHFLHTHRFFSFSVLFSHGRFAASFLGCHSTIKVGKYQAFITKKKKTMNIKAQYKNAGTISWRGRTASLQKKHAKARRQICRRAL